MLVRVSAGGQMAPSMRAGEGTALSGGLTFLTLLLMDVHSRIAGLELLTSCLHLPSHARSQEQRERQSKQMRRQSGDEAEQALYQPSSCQGPL